MSGNDNAQDDHEAIRLKRLARLAALASQSTPTPSAGSPSNPAQPTPPRQAGPSSNSRLLSTPSPSNAGRPASPQPKRPAPQPSSAPAGFPKKPTASYSAARSTEAVGPRVVGGPQTQLVPPSVPYRQWEADKIARVFSVTLSKNEAEKSDYRLCWLKELETDLAEEEPDRPKPFQTTPDLIDRLLIARLQIDPTALASSNDPDQLAILAGLPQNETVFEYLTGCWRRLYIANRETHRVAYPANEKATWAKTFEAVKALIISYCGLTLEDPSMFPQPTGKPLGPQEFLPILLAQTSVSSGSSDPLTASSSAPTSNLALASSDLIPFLNDLSARFGSDSSELHGVIEPTISFLLQQWFAIVPAPDILGPEWRKYLGALAVLAQVKPIAALLPKMAIWVAPGVTAEKIEWMSLLGPLSRLSVFPRDFPQIWKSFFSNPTDRKVGDIDANKSNLRGTLGGLHDSLFNLFNAIVRASPDAREGVLDYFALAATLNKKRSGSRVDPKTVATDGYMINLQVVLMRLFQPVMDVQFSKIDKVDPDYFKLSKRLSIEDETKIKATKEEADAYFGTGDAMDVDSSSANFISDLFFLTNSYQYLGVTKTLSNRSRAEKNISEMEKELKRTEASSGDWVGNPALQAQGDAAIKKLKGDIATLHASIHAYDTQLQDPAFIQQIVAFLSFTMTWLVRLVDPTHQHPKVAIKLPLPAEAPLRFRMLPEYIIESIAEFFEFVSRYLPDALENMDKDILITFIIVFLSPGYVNNPFLKAKFVAILANGTYPAGYYRKGFMFDRLNYHPLSTDYLMPTLVRFFIEAESTGGHTQFWDKFNMRRHMSRLFKAMWDSPLHREAFVKSRHDNFDQFIKFINMLMSDTTFHLEESLTSLTKIHQTRNMMANTAEWEARPEAERKDLLAQMQQAEGSAPFHTQMGRDHVELIEKFTATTKEPFLAAEIVERLAATLDENLVTLVGPKMQELKLADADAFSFKPKKLLAAISQIYINLGSSPEFVRAVANDGRSYSKSLFERFARVLKNRAIMVDGEVQALLAFCQKVEDTKATIEIEDEREIPDEFLDPLLATLMKDPVILPVSRQVIDRGTIRAVLLSKEVDPFNNVPLKFEDCEPDVELKARIDAWVAQGKAQPAAEVMDVDDA